MYRGIPYFELLNLCVCVYACVCVCVFFVCLFGALEVETGGIIREHNEIYSSIKVIDLGQGNEGNSNKC